MNALAHIDDAVFIQDEQVKTTSLKVAEIFGKQHKDVLRKIESLDCSSEFTSAHFCAHVQTIQAGAVHSVLFSKTIKCWLFKPVNALFYEHSHAKKMQAPTNVH